ncbi:MAG: hypothetical protein FWD66_08960, partial [Paludibacter sp.]|nr:hypothetical protein [Paludibacter sp.]
TISILENVSEYFENMYKNVSEKLAVNSWYKEYFESGQVKIDSGSATEQNTERTENQNITQTINYKEKYFELIDASERQHSALLSYAYENDSLRQVIGNSEQLQIDTATTAKTGLNWWQKTQIIGFWVLLAVVGLWVGIRG